MTTSASCLGDCLPKEAGLVLGQGHKRRRRSWAGAAMEVSRLVMAESERENCLPYWDVEVGER